MGDLFMNKGEALKQDLGMRVVKLCIIVGVLFLFRYLVSYIKVFDEMRFFDTRLTVLDIAIAVVNAIILVFLIKFGFYLSKHYEVVNFPKAMIISKWLVILIAAIVAYQTYYRIARSLLRRHDIDAYNVVFLCVTLLILVRLGVLVFSNMEKITDLFTGKIKVDLKEPGVDEDLVKEGLKCKSCGKSLEKDMAFCSKCGTKAA
jgi:Kef-type K+ transport system membrane component KefB